MLENRLLDLRVDNDITQQQLADFLHVHQTTYSDYETGKLNIPIEVLVKLADYYNTSVDYILRRTSCMKPHNR